ncbi:D-alanyl-D-alanine carboxypeptidase family protein [Actinotalea sp. BY-33]|uniref:D-alanyl-D-alanine carboxypeptidase family protein n=1 Tax=Actinotalea soli TaxID=2819234 RepID=A0A939RSV1_9CELL|nr:M15 family metallopeptidase [Actinotalea soli]MBO1752587.1 D-alanyl-D-alanine carboxypeptidase family protein [Actinotalea soli]
MILLSDPRVSAVPVLECAEPLVELGPEFGPAGALVRSGVADRLAAARAALPAGLALRVQEGHRPVAEQRAIIATYAAEVAVAHPGASAAEHERLVSRFVAPVAVAPHVAGAAVDLTLTRPGGADLDMGTPIDATPEASGGRCYTASREIGTPARMLREVLGRVLGDAGLVNYPTEWWHWSYGDRYWALMTGAPAARYGPVAAAGSSVGTAPSVGAAAMSGVDR